MSDQICSGCFKPKAKLSCGLCHIPLCKYCARFLEEERLTFFSRIPDELAQSVYCHSCYTEKAEPQLEAFYQLLAKAKEVLIFDKNQGKETRLIKRLEEPVQVKNCIDHNETLLRLAFFSAQKNLNGLIDVDIVSEKVRDGSYQTTKWSGTGLPAQISTEKLLKDRSLSKNPN